MDNAKVNVYPEGLKFLAQQMDIPFPKEDMEAREAYIIGIINFIAGL